MFRGRIGNIPTGGGSCTSTSTRSRTTEDCNGCPISCGSYARAEHRGVCMMRGVLMAGGEGSRLRPLTSRRPKPLAPVAGKPVMEQIIQLLKKHGFDQVASTPHHLADEIEAYFGDGEALGIKMHYVVEDTPLGTAGAVKLAHEHLAGEPFLIISGA